MLEPEGTFVGTSTRTSPIESIAGRHLPARQRLLADPPGAAGHGAGRGRPRPAARRSPSGWARRPARSTELSAAVSALRRRSRRGSRPRRRWRGSLGGASRGGRRAAGRVPRRSRSACSARCPRRTHRRRALLRRGGRHAARHSRAVRQPDQPRVGARAPQAVLPPVQLRAAGRGHRRRDAAVARARSTRSRWRPCSGSSSPRRSETSWCRRCSTRRCSAPTGAGTRRSRSPFPGAGAAGEFRRSSSGCSRKTCSPRPFPTPRPAWRTFPATGRSPTIRSCGRAVSDCVNEVMDCPV